jgi:hypothetical protein
MTQLDTGNLYITNKYSSTARRRTSTFLSAKSPSSPSSKMGSRRKETALRRRRTVSVLVEYDKLLGVCWLRRGCTGGPLDN